MRRTIHHQTGVSITGLIFVLAILAMLGLLGAKIVPTVSEYSSIKKAIVKAKNAGGNPIEIRNSFDRQATVDYITAITSRDLEITPSGSGGFEVSFAYDKKIPLVGPASLLIEYAGSTEKKQKAAKGRD